MADPIAQRKAMIESQLRPQAVTDSGVLAAMASVPREQFVPQQARSFAYYDRSIDLGDGRWMMAPAALGRLLSELAPVPGERALVIGSTGYAAALLRAIGLIVEEGGVDSRGAFDLVLVEGAVEELPPALARRIAPGGRIGVALRDGAVTRLALGTVAGGTMSFRSFADADVPLLQAFAKPRAFTF